VARGRLWLCEKALVRGANHDVAQAPWRSITLWIAYRSGSDQRPRLRRRIASAAAAPAPNNDQMARVAGSGTAGAAIRSSSAQRRTSPRWAGLCQSLAARATSSTGFAAVAFWSKAETTSPEVSLTVIAPWATGVVARAAASQLRCPGVSRYLAETGPIWLILIVPYPAPNPAQYPALYL